MKAHLVLVTKYRKKVITAEILSRLAEIVQSVSEKWGCQVIKVNGEADHIHLLFSYYPQMQVSKFVNNLKTVTSRMIRKEFPQDVQKFYSKPLFWSESYFVASSGGVTVERLKQYVQSQDSASESDQDPAIHPGPAVNGRGGTSGG
ncbi:ISSoc10, orfA transposase [Microseira wollei NIES-4236]|uniref:ISSoc10, orfA transposase n=2 Tax=Microseira wollei TaxID=467598 RepID=A0AAV3XD36_9CYAN|nr:ISSoc10, orfA transposase [Microseira wollei NIES-4236]